MWLVVSLLDSAALEATLGNTDLKVCFLLIHSTDIIIKFMGVTE